MVRDESQQGIWPPSDSIKSSGSSRVATTVWNLNRTTGASASRVPIPSKRREIAIDGSGRFTILSQDEKHSRPDLSRNRLAQNGPRSQAANAPTQLSRTGQAMQDRARAEFIIGIQSQRKRLDSKDSDTELKAAQQKILAKGQGSQAPQSKHALKRSDITNSYAKSPQPISKTRELNANKTATITLGGSNSVLSSKVPRPEVIKARREGDHALHPKCDLHRSDQTQSKPEIPQSVSGSWKLNAIDTATITPGGSSSAVWSTTGQAEYRKVCKVEGAKFKAIGHISHGHRKYQPEDLAQKSRAAEQLADNTGGRLVRGTATDQFLAELSHVPVKKRMDALFGSGHSVSMNRDEKAFWRVERAKREEA